ncbi:ABC transporter ATP-binding protein [Sulfidibacter corallicola]|uniref:ABC transporter ATP-binding protein n=1 Tax=Sulfidibacter corallicola TaxID=2818388 RepID=A0A8A4TUN9_SULCO|nr:ABC transporter ATP-binding protein [Sulfidibacter corallicola]QTD52831.1 ABC transporter ATP-binding protein [Sulfidibacter corallicola]
MSMPALATFRHYLKTILETSGRRLVPALLLMPAVGVLEGVGVIMLLPMLALIGLGESKGDGGLHAAIAAAFDALHLPLNLETVLIVFAALMVTRRLLSRWNEVLSATLQQDLVWALRSRFYRALMAARWPFFTANRSSDFVQALTTDMNRIGHGCAHLLRVTATLMLLAAYLVPAMLTAPTLTGLTLAIGALVFAVLRGRIRRASLDGERITHITNGLYATVSEHMAGIKVAKSFGAEARNLQRFERITGDIRDLLLNFNRNVAGAQLWFSLGSTLIFCSFFYVAVRWFQLPSASLLLLILIFARMMPLVSALQQQTHHLAHMLPAFASYRDLLQRCRAATEIETADGCTHQASFPLREEVRFVDVGFRYENQNEGSLEGLSLNLRANQTTALCGPSGAGKSTVADLLLGLLSPQTGHIEVDGRVLEKSDHRAWRSTIAYVPQETFLFFETVADNLRWAAPEASDADLWLALDQAAAADFVKRLPQGLDTVVGERGVRLSGGERQRLALARALLIKPRLLILDEATSALDTENEERIFAALEALHGSMTILIIAHRLTTLRGAERIYVLDGGRLAQEGTHEALATQPGLYQSLLKHQDPA